MRDSAGVRIVTNAAPRWDPGEGWVVRSDPRLEIGRGDGDAEPSLHRVSAALRLADGTIVVANAGSSELLIFDGTGRFLRSFGREGEGPGEFVRLAGIALLEDTLLAFDASLGRLSLFSLPNEEARRFLESIPLPQLLPAHGPALVVDRLGHLWVQAYRPRFDPSPDTWSVFDPSGHWLGRVRLPDGFRVFEIGRDYVLGLWRGELDVEHVVLHDLDRSQ